jgi:RHS repeat-associated protein
MTLAFDCLFSRSIPFSSFRALSNRSTSFAPAALVLLLAITHAPAIDAGWICGEVTVGQKSGNAELTSKKECIWEPMTAGSLPTQPGGPVGNPSTGGPGGNVPNPGNNDEVRDADESDCEDRSGNPIVLSTGNKIEPETDFAIQGEMGLSLRRTYNHYWAYYGLFGKHWVSSFDYSLVPQGANVLWAQRPDGRRIKYLYNANQQRWNEDRAQPLAYIVKNPDNSYTHFTEEHTVERYNAFGYVLDVKNRRNIGWTFSYSGNYLQQIAHTSGRKVLFGWTGNQLTQVTDPAGNIYTYSYAANAFGANKHRLSGIALPGAPATTVSYHYEKPNFPGALTGKSYNGARYSTFDYDASGRATLSEHPGEVDRHVYDYDSGSVPQPPNPPPFPPPPGGECDPDTGICTHPDSVGDPVDAALLAQRAAIAQAADAVITMPLADSAVTVTNPLNKQTTYEFADGLLTTITGHPSTHCAASYREHHYDANGNDDTAEDFNGNLTDFNYTATAHLLKRIDGVGTSEARATNYDWDVPNNRLNKMTVAGDHEDSYAYWPDHRLRSVTVKNLSSNGVANETQVTNYAYTTHGNGLVATMTVDGPLPGTGDAVTYGYSAQGDLISVVNSLGHASSYSQYNALGQPGRITGPNGEAAEYQYDPRGRLKVMRTFRNGGQQDTTYMYNGAGLLEKTVTPDGVTESYVYDNARRLKEVHRSEPDGAAKKLLAYNANSQVIREEIYRGNTLRYRAYTDYDELGRVRGRRGNHGQDVEFAYDSNDNLEAVTDSLGKATTFDYDALNRRTAQIDPLGRITRYTYDAGDRVESITDPRNLVTTYAYDGFGQLRSQTSPDSGTTTHTWDANGRLSTTKRADNVTATYGYDGLGRRTSAIASGQNHTFAYDTCANGKGRLCTLTDSSQTLDLGYTPYGELSARTPTINGSPVNLGHGFTYDALGRLIKITYPNNVEASYSYTLDRVTSLTVKINGQNATVANAITYEPMGPMKQLAFGNGGGRINHYDTDYRLSDIETDLKVGYHFEFDPNDRIEGFTNFANGYWSQSFGYDDLHRLTASNSAGLGSHVYAYDANGNRKTHGTATYTIANGSNRLTGVGGRTYIYTPTGNVRTITGFGGGGETIFRNGFQIEPLPVTTYSYDPFDRLIGVSGPDISASYRIGADGLRYQKNVGGETTRFVYGPSAMLLSEHRQNPARWTNYLWLNGQPVGLVRTNALYWIQNDHLGRPEGITDQNRQRVWRANLKAFDRTVITDLIGGFHLGFPGQYHDTETGHAHNINRDYDPGTGRYLQADPIGLAGGINPYVYAESNPVNVIDPLGLCGMGTAMGMMANSNGDLTGMNVTSRAQQMQSQAERYAREKAVEAGKDAGKCAARKAVENMIGDFALSKGLDGAENMLPDKLGAAIGWGRAAWSVSPISWGLTGGFYVRDAYTCISDSFGKNL